VNALMVDKSMSPIDLSELKRTRDLLDIV